MIIAGTGHRNLNESTALSLINDVLEETKPEAVIVGMAAGFDLLLGECAIMLGLPVWAARPWAGHKATNDCKKQYSLVMDRAEKIINVSDSETYAGPWLYHKRNEWMVDNATHLLAWFNGQEKGGTYTCIKYANKVGKPVKNIYKV